MKQVFNAEISGGFMSKSFVAATTFDELPLILNVTDVASILSISKVSAYGLVKSNGFPVVRVGRRIKIPKAAFITWLDNQTAN